MGLWQAQDIGIIVIVFKLMEFMSHVYHAKVLCIDIMRLQCFNVG